jgi:hypothetical protein
VTKVFTGAKYARSGCRLPLRAQHGAALLSGQPEGRRWESLIRAHLRSGDRQHQLRGGHRPQRPTGWHPGDPPFRRLADLFDFGDGNVKPNKKIDDKVSTPLLVLPLATIANHQPPIALPQRNLLRQVTWSMPSGQDVARTIGVTPLTPNDLRELKAYGMGLEVSTPLWYYVLKEAALVPDTDIGQSTGGFHLGPVGGPIVGEVIVGLLKSDPNSWVSSRPSWTPTLQNPGSQFRMVDFLTFAGVDPATRHSQQPGFA